MHLIVLLTVATALALDSTPYTTLGVPIVVGPINRGAWSQFTVSLDTIGDLTAQETLVFAATPFSGDADIFVSTTQAPDSLDCYHCIINSTSPFDEVTSLAKQDPRWPTTGTTFYVGVYAYTQTEFTFNVWTDRTNVTVIETIPQAGRADIQKVVFYEYKLPASENFTVSVTPRGGDMDVFITTDPTVRPVSTATSMWQGTDIGFDTVAINSNHPKYKGEGSTYYIGVKGYSYNRIFTIFVTMNNNYTRVAEGIPMTMVAEAHEFKYFEFDVTSDYAGHRVTFTLYALKTGSDPDIYITRDISTGHPGPSNCQWCHAQVGDDAIEIEYAQAGKYYIGIQAYQKRAHFQFTAATEYQSILLTESMASTGHVKAGKYAYYRWYMGNPREQNQILVSPSGGTVELYESKTAPNPDESKYERKGIPEGNNRVINHKPNEDWNAKWYYFSVKGNQDSNYTFSITTNYTAVALQDGRQTYYQYVANSYYKYFTFDINNHDLRDPENAFAFTVSALSGDADIFISMDNHRPTKNDYQWKSDEYKSDTLVIYANDTNIGDHRRFYVAVFGAGASGSDTYFTILAHKSNSSVFIPEAQVVASSVEFNKYTYFKYSVNDPSYQGPVTFRVDTAVAANRVKVYIGDDTIHRPTSSHYVWKSDYEVYNITESHSDVYYIGVLGWFRASSNPMIDFNITVSRIVPPTTTAAPTTEAPTTTPAPTTTLAPTTTQEPTTTATPTPTTVAPTTAAPTTTIVPTPAPTTSGPTPTTAAPSTTTTTVAPVPTPSGVVTQVETATGVSLISGDDTKLPSPVPGMLLLYTTTGASASITVSQFPPSNIYKAIVSFHVEKLASIADVRVVLKDKSGQEVGSKTVTVSTAVMMSVDVSDLVAKKGRRIQADTLYWSLVAVTPNVAISVDPTVVYTVQYIPPTPTQAPGIGFEAVSAIIATAVIVVVAIAIIIIGLVLYRKRKAQKVEVPSAYEDLELEGEAQNRRLLPK